MAFVFDLHVESVYCTPCDGPRLASSRDKDLLFPLNGTTWDTIHRNRIPLLLRLLANYTGCTSHICDSDRIHLHRE